MPLSLGPDLIGPLCRRPRCSLFSVTDEETRRVQVAALPRELEERGWTRRSRAGAGPGPRRVLIYSPRRGLAAQRGD